MHSEDDVEDDEADEALLRLGYWIGMAAGWG